tara:strand:+ start:298 stop:462 length:165 start_codon:yes stop_codon:yes gene_type:complete
MMRGFEMTIVKLFNDGVFIAESYAGTARFVPPDFFYSAVYDYAVSSFHASCDKF